MGPSISIIYTDYYKQKKKIFPWHNLWGNDVTWFAKTNKKLVKMVAHFSRPTSNFLVIYRRSYNNAKNCVLWRLEVRQRLVFIVQKKTLRSKSMSAARYKVPLYHIGLWAVVMKRRSFFWHSKIIRLFIFKYCALEGEITKECDIL